MQTAKETATKIAASAKSGLDKTKATVQEKVEKLTAHDPLEKEMATKRKDEKIAQAEINKQMVIENATKPAATGGKHTGLHTVSAVPVHGTGQPQGEVAEGVAVSRPIGLNTRVGGATTESDHMDPVWDPQ